VFPTGSAYAHAGFGLDWSGKLLRITEREERQALCLEDFSRAKKVLEAVLDSPCPFICLPWGQFDEITLEASAKTGHLTALTLERTFVGPGSPNIGRIAVKDAKTTAWLRNKLFLHAYSLHAKLFRTRLGSNTGQP
jgi:hypothetical protein